MENKVGALILRYMLWKAEDVILPILSTLERTKTRTSCLERIPCRMFGGWHRASLRQRWGRWEADML
jgi:hypothetical protein